MSAGIREFSAIVNPPQSCILAVGASEQRAVVRDGALAVATLTTCTLSADHRLVDGVLGAEFMGALRRLVEAPLSLLAWSGWLDEPRPDRDRRWPGRVRRRAAPGASG